MSNQVITKNYLTFKFFEKSKSGKTDVWIVKSDKNIPLGYIKWNGPWRCYSFFPVAPRIFGVDLSMKYRIAFQ